MNGFYQIYGRDNDPSGNPQRLIFLYDSNCEVHTVYHVGTSQRSNTQGILDELGCKQIHSVHLTIKEFNATKRAWQNDKRFQWAD